MKKKKIVLIGASLRVGTLVKAIKQNYDEEYELCALLDCDEKKMCSFNVYHGLKLPVYSPEDFNKMCSEIRPDIAIITTVDATHAAYVVRCLDHKISCLVEKPLCTTASQCRDILNAADRNPEVYARTMHNSRYHSTFRKVKELVDFGIIGKIRSISFNEKLDLFHGSSYFRRWNRTKALSGGLQIHKSSHHFDKINFLLNAKPITVTASGNQIAYGPNASNFRGERCAICRFTADCPFYLDISKNPVYNEIYLQNRTDDEHDYYAPDLCVFSPDADAEDFFNVYCRYDSGIVLDYSLCAHCNYEGETLLIDGEAGRLEMNRLSFRCIEEQGRDKLLRQENILRLIRFGDPEVVSFNVDDESGESHGGCDRLIYADLFGNANSGMLADLAAGIQAVLVGIAANISMSEGHPVSVQNLLKKGE